MNGKLATPDISVAQVVAVVGAVLGVLVAAGLDISKDLQDAIISLITVLAPVLIAGDALIRHGRSRAFTNAPKPIEGDSGSNNPLTRGGGA